MIPGPVWRNMQELLQVLKAYRAMYAKGLTDVQINMALWKRYRQPYEGQRRFVGNGKKT